VFGGQLLKPAGQPLQLIPPGDHPVGRRPGIGDPILGADVHRNRPATAQVRVGLAPGDGEQPGADLGLASERARRSPDRNQGVLEHLLGEVGVGDELADERPQRLAVAAVEGLEAAPVPGGNRPHGVGVTASGEHRLIEGTSHHPTIRFTGAAAE
jgi:hypothetical protein